MTAYVLLKDNEIKLLLKCITINLEHIGRGFNLVEEKECREMEDKLNSCSRPYTWAMKKK